MTRFIIMAYTLVYDIYFCTDGKSTLKAENMEMDDFTVYDDMILVATMGSSYSEYELSMISENGNQVIIADDVSQYVRADEKNMLYISDLYVYDGKERKLLGLDVDYFWTKDKIEMKLKTDEWC